MKHFVSCILPLVFIFFNETDAQSLYDVFPFRVGTIYRYDFKERYYHINYRQYPPDSSYSSGSLVYTIVDSTSSVDSTVWTISIGGNRTGIIKVTEKKTDLHELRGSDGLGLTGLGYWQFPPIDMNFPPSEQIPFPIYRYSHSMDTAISHPVNGGYDSLFFSTAKGFYRRTWFQQHSGGSNGSDHSERSISLSTAQPHSVILGLVNLIPKSFYLAQNYPNPFNPTTQLQFTIASPGFVTLKIYNVIGSEIARLVNEQKEQGVYNLQWDASNMPSGVYLYCLQSGYFTATRRMVLVK